MDIDSFSISKNGMPPYRKSTIIWAVKANTSSPLAYLRKPKSLSDADWSDFLDSIQIARKPK